MNKSYDVYMCKNEQIEGDLTSVIGKSIQVIHSEKYKDVLGKMPKGWKICIHRDGDWMTGVIKDVVITK